MAQETLAGTWKLAAEGGFKMVGPDGSESYPMGERCAGLLVLDAGGTLSAQLMRPDRPLFQGEDVLRGSDEEIRSAYEGFASFWGTYELDEAQKQLTYHVEGSLYPNWIGHANQRFYQLDGDRLTLKTPPFDLAGTQGYVGVLVWERNH